jgi:hypothetical protein
MQELFVQNARATKDIEELQSIRKGRDEMKRQKSDRLQALSFEEITGKMNEDEKQSYVRELYDRSKEFEKNNRSVISEKSNIRELEDIRSSRSEGDMEKDEGRDIEDDQTEGVSDIGEADTQNSPTEPDELDVNDTEDNTVDDPDDNQPNPS